MLSRVNFSIVNYAVLHQDEVKVIAVAIRRFGFFGVELRKCFICQPANKAVCKWSVRGTTPLA